MVFPEIGEGKTAPTDSPKNKNKKDISSESAEEYKLTMEDKIIKTHVFTHGVDQ